VREPKFYSCDDDVETLTHTDIDEAIEDYLDRFWPAAWEFKDKERERIAVFLGALPNEIEVYGYARMEFEDHHLDAECLLQRIFEHIEEDELGDPDGRDFEDAFSDKGARVVEAAKKLVNEIRDTYEPWACDIVQTTKFNPIDWIREHRPDWLDSASHKAGLA